MRYPEFVPDEHYFTLHDGLRPEQQLQGLADNIKHIHHLSTEHFDSFEALIDTYIEAGLEIFDMETGIVSHICDHKYEVDAIISPLDAIHSGDMFDLQDTYCREVIATHRVIGFPHIGKHEDMCLHPVYENLKLEAYLSAPIWINESLYGTLNFTSRQPRLHGFSEHERDLIAMMANAIGNFLLLKNNEQELKSINEQLKRFVGYVSHDLRNPLGVIKNMSKMGGNHTEKGSRAEDILQRIETTADSTLELVTSILDISALGTGKIIINTERCDLANIIEKSISMAQPIAKLQEQNLSSDLVESLMISADSSRLSQVFSNLINNACKYAPPKSHIDIGVKISPPVAIISVSNTIADHFDSDAESLLPSTGFGLQIVRELLSAHDSKLDCSQVDRQFIAQFPLTLASQND